MNVCLCVCATATPNTCHCISSHHLLHGNSISYMKCMKTMYYRTFHQTFLSLFDGILFTFNHFHAIYSVLPWRKFRLSVATAVIVTLSFIFLSQLFVSNFFLHLFPLLFSHFCVFVWYVKTWCKCDEWCQKIGNLNDFRLEIFWRSFLRAYWWNRESENSAHRISFACAVGFLCNCTRWIWPETDIK